MKKFIVIILMIIVSAAHAAELAERAAKKVEVGSPIWWKNAKTAAENAGEAKEAARKAEKLAPRSSIKPVMTVPPVIEVQTVPMRIRTVAEKEAEDKALAELEMQKAQQALDKLDFYRKHPANMPPTGISLLSNLSDEVKLPVLLQNVGIAKDSMEAGALVRKLASTDHSWDSIINGKNETNALATAIQNRFGIPRTATLVALGTPRAARLLLDEASNFYTKTLRADEIRAIMNTINDKKQAEQPLTPLERQLEALNPTLGAWAESQVDINTSLFREPDNFIDYILADFSDTDMSPQFIKGMQFGLTAGFKPSAQILQVLLSRFKINQLGFILRNKMLSQEMIENLYQSALKWYYNGSFSPEGKQIFRNMIELIMQYRTAVK